MSAGAAEKAAGVRSFRSDFPCPICGGHERIERGHGKRCHGFLSTDGRYAHCSREEHAGQLEFESEAATYAHRLNGPCRCGETHGTARPTGDTDTQSSGPGKVVAKYVYRDEEARPLFEVQRWEPKSFTQARIEQDGKRVSGSGCMKGVRRVLYRLPEVINAVAAGDRVYVVEGERDVHAAEEAGLVATTAPSGAGKWRPDYSEFLRDADVTVVRDKDKKGHRHADHIAASAGGIARSIEIREAKEGNDLSDHLAAGHTVEDLVLVKNGEEPEGLDEDETTAERPERPTIFLADRQLDDLADDAIEALVQANTPPTLFMRSEGVATVRRDEEGHAIVAEVGETEITERLAGAARWLRETKSGTKNAGPTRTVSGVVRARLIRCRDQFPPLRGVTESPLLRADGSILDRPGYDHATRLYYMTSKPMDFSGVPAEPSPTDIESAVCLIVDEMIVNFPFASEADKATAIAGFLTLVMREAIPGCVPAFLLDGPVAGTGKGLLADAITTAATGGLGAKTTAPDNRGDDEWRKRITAMFLEGRAVCVLDNVEQPIGSAALAAALTTEVWSDRILGRSRMANMANRATWLITGNNLRVRGDLPRRCVWCRLDAKLARPWTRTDFTHPALLEWVRENRRDLLVAGFTLGRAWFAQGQPEPGPHVPLLGSFEGWRHVVGGTLEVAGVKEFLGNLDRLYATIDDDSPAWAAFLSAWHEVYGDSPITVASLIADLERDDRRDLRDALPDDLATSLDAESEGSRRKRFGKALSRKKETRFPVDDDGRTLRIVQDDTRTHKAARWRVSE